MRWFPLAMIVMMLGAVVEALYHRQYAKAFFWTLDAMMTATTAYLLH